jgi:hypothetical protein
METYLAFPDLNIVKKLVSKDGPTLTRRSLHCQVENHVRTKFATPILYAIDIFLNYDIFSLCT